MSTAPGVRRLDGSGSPGDVFQLLREGVATSRSALARATGLAPSTISLRVEQLRRQGLVVEDGDEGSRGGRRARRLHVKADAGLVAAADVGAHHVRIGVADLLGHRLTTRELPLDVAQGPDVVLPGLWRAVLEVLGGAGLDPSRLLGLGLGFPAPIDATTGRVVLPSGMPGWHGTDVLTAFGALTDVPVFVENDANLVAIAAHAAAGPGVEHLLAVKLGTRIGCGIVSAGRLHRGAGGAAGEVSHVPVAGTAVISCSCSVQNCLESVASGGALVRRLQLEGHPVQAPADVTALAAHGDVHVITTLRDAGNLVGEVLAGVVNFFNPKVVTLSGAMSAAEPFVAAVRGTLFQRCLPLTAGVLEVQVTTDGADAGLSGALRLVLENVLSADRIDGLIHP
ncbi:ROK family protein [Kineococcus sp. SYSU DK002]|uniref:ROK family protein n=1 Tax=Kineococcus sp. SYSU DK002 TaxID=3383123 RepID=UPI003D7E41CB